MPPFDIMGSFQDPLNLDEGAAKLVNVRAVPREMTEGKVSKVRLIGAPGLPVVCQPTTSPCIVVSHSLGTIWSGHADGSIYYDVDTPAPVLSGFVAVNPIQPVIRFTEDRTALAIASNSNVLNASLFGTGYTATQQAGVVNAGFDVSIDFDPSAVAELDNFTLWSAASNTYANQDSKVYRSQPLAPANVQPNSFGTKEARADRVVDLAVSGRVLWPFGSRSLEQWYDSGANTDMPFIPYPNSLNSVGLAARLSLSVLRDVIMFVGTDRRIWRAMGQSAKAISSAWVDLLLQQLTAGQLGQLTSYAYGQGGSDFYLLTLPGQWTIELAGSTGVWSYRRSPGRLDHVGRCAVEHDGGVTYIGLDTGHICTVDLNSSAEPAGTLDREIITPWVGSEETRDTIDSIDVTSAMGPQAGTFLLDWSLENNVTVNGALVTPRTWRGLRSINLPQPGQQRAIGRNFGTTRRRQFRLRYDGTQAPFTLDEFFAQVSPGF